MLIMLALMSAAWVKNMNMKVKILSFYCPNCDNEIQGKLSIYEYPVGCFNYEQITDVEDSFATKQSYFKEPRVAFFDLYGGKDTKNFTKGFFTRKPFMALKVGIYSGDEYVAF